jgi:polysaccharide biosynthesis transport protein
MDLHFLFNALLRKKWVILICTLAGIAAGVLVSLTKKKLYLSAAQYSTGFTMKQQVKLSEGDMGMGVFEVDQRFKNVIETFKSPVVIAMLSYDLMLHDLEEKEPYKKLDEKALKKPAYTEAMADIANVKRMLMEKRMAKDILKAYNKDEKKVYELIKLYGYDNETLLNTLVVDRVAGTDYLNILFRSENPEMSAYVVNGIGDEFIRFYSSINSGRTEESAGRLDSLARKKKQEIDSLNNALQSFKAGFGTPDVSDRAKGSMEIEKEASTKLFEAQSTINDLRAELNSVNTQLENLKSIPTVAANSGGNNNAEYVSLLNKNRELAAEMSRKPGGFDAELDAQMKANQKKIQQLSLGSTKGSNTDANDARKRKEDLLNQKITIENKIRAQEQTISSLSSVIGKANTDSRQGAGADVKVIAMQQKIEMANKQYELMLNKLQGAQDISLAPDINFKQTLLGQPAIMPESSNRKMLIGLSAFASLLLASLIIVMLDFADQSLRAPSIFNRIVKLKLLSVVYNTNLKSKDVSDYFAINSSDGSGKITNQLVEAMRKLRYEIEASGKKIILFTSTKPREGKSTIIEALANSFSLSKKRVLLIDTNFPNNTLTEKFNAKPLLEQFNANGEKDISVKLIDITSATPISSCDIVGCSEGNYSPAEILPKNNLLEYLSAISIRYDFIFLEGSSLNEHADTKELAKYADAIIPVFSARSSIKQADLESLKFLKSNPEKLLGAVLNEVEKDNANL